MSGHGQECADDCVHPSHGHALWQIPPLQPFGAPRKLRVWLKLRDEAGIRAIVERFNRVSPNGWKILLPRRSDTHDEWRGLNDEAAS